MPGFPGSLLRHLRLPSRLLLPPGRRVPPVSAPSAPVTPDKRSACISPVSLICPSSSGRPCHYRFITVVFVAPSTASTPAAHRYGTARHSAGVTRCLYARAIIARITLRSPPALRHTNSTPCRACNRHAAMHRSTTAAVHFIASPLRAQPPRAPYGAFSLNRCLRLRGFAVARQPTQLAYSYRLSAGSSSSAHV